MTTSNPDRSRKPDGSQPGRQSKPVKPEKLSRFLSFLLRHHPEQAGLALDAEGRVSVAELVAALRYRRGFEALTPQDVERAVRGPGAGRFELRDGRVRAFYGHTLTQAVRYDEAAPPPVLFFGTTPEAAEAALASGLLPVDRRCVHLSADALVARDVGRRRVADPVVLRIDTAAARDAGVRFYSGGPAVWMADAIPAACLAPAN
jgi:putative RNA 2'-phosphotransferase